MAVQCNDRLGGAIIFFISRLSPQCWCLGQGTADKRPKTQLFPGVRGSGYK